MTVVADAGREKYGQLPWPARWCNYFTVAQVVACVATVLVHPIGPTMTPDPAEIARFQLVRTMLAPALLLEFAQVLSSASDGVSHAGGGMSKFVMAEYCIKMTYYTLMATFDGAIVHQNLRAQDVRPIYAPRWIGWCLAVPTLIIINNYPLIDGMSFRHFWWRLLPNLNVTWTYCVTCWLGTVVHDPWVGWGLIFLSFLAYLAATMDQVYFLVERSDKTSWFGYKCAIVMVKEIAFFIYGVVYLLGNWGMMSSYSVQSFFSFGDVFIKVSLASVIVIFRNWDDITQIQRLGSQVIKGQEDMANFIKLASVPILVLDASGVIMAWNAKLAALSRIPTESALRKRLIELLAESCHDAYQAALLACRDPSSAGSGVFELFLRPIKSADGKSDMQVQLLMNFIVTTGQTTDGNILGIGQDLTELINMKAVEERKSRFTAIVSHELRSPLHGITGLTTALLEVIEDEGYKKQLTMIHGCVRRLLDLVTNIMEMAQLDRREKTEGQMEITRNPVNMMAVVEEVMWMTQMAVDKAGKPLITAKVELRNEMQTGKLPVVMGDAYKFSQLFYNLITNACKFTDNGSVTVRARHYPEREQIEVDVQDTGKGIEQNALKRIFIPFEQENTKDSRSFQGIGLGLSVALGIAKMHQGEIKVKSDLGVGSTFTVVLPCQNNMLMGLDHPVSAIKPVMPKTALPTGAVAAAKRPVFPSVNGNKPLFLCADDDEIVQEILEKSLQCTHRIVRVRTAEDVLQYLKKSEQAPSVILLDVQSPMQKGAEVAKMIRETNAFKSSSYPTFLLTARPLDQGVGQAGAAGQLRPFSSQLLKQKLTVLSAVQKDWPPPNAMGPAGLDAKARAAADAMTVTLTDAARFEAAEVATMLETRLRSAERHAAEGSQKMAELKAKSAEAARLNVAAAASKELQEKLKLAEASLQEAKKQVEESKKEAEESRQRAQEASRNAASISAEELEHIHQELDLRGETIVQLRDKAERWHAEALMQHEQVEALSRELHFLRGGMAEDDMSRPSWPSGWDMSPRQRPGLSDWGTPRY